MVDKIFISYRRDDDPAAAARVRDGLAVQFGKPSLFMDVDNLLAGQRFDEELAKSLSVSDVLIAILGQRWMEVLKAKSASGERDYVREEIGEALKRRIVVIPVRVGRDGQMPPLPKADDLPPEIRDLVHYQKHDIVHEHFGRDIAALISAIRVVRKSRRPQRAPLTWARIAAGAAGIAVMALIGAHFAGAPLLSLSTTADHSSSDNARKEIEGERAARLKAEAEAQKLRDEAEARRRADEAERERQTKIKAEQDVAPKIAAVAPPVVKPMVKNFFGMELANPSEDVRQRYKLGPGATGVVVTQVKPDSEAAEKKIEVGDRIVEVAQQAVSNLDDFETRLEALKTGGRKTVLLFVMSGDGSKFVALSLPPPLPPGKNL
jgi:hypothetical protein